MTSSPEESLTLDPVELIQGSMRVLFFGLPGFIPFLGLPFALVALRQNSLIKRSRGPQWNPAGRYLYWGAICARIGLTLTILFTLLIAAAIALELLT